MQITANFSMEELTSSTTADKLHIDNTPNNTQQLRLMLLAHDVLQPIRDAYRKPVIVSSGFRCYDLNKAVGGAAGSQHMYGEAADIHSISDSRDANKKLFNVILKLIDDKKIEVGQLINEHNYDWIHVSLPNQKHRNEILYV